MPKTYYSQRRKNLISNIFIRFFYGTILGSVFLVILIITLFNLSLKSPLNISKEFLFEIEKGQSLSDILEIAEKNNIIKNKVVLLIYSILTNKDRGIQTGFYELTPKINGYDFLEMISGKGDYYNKGIKITILEGYTINEIIDNLNKNGINIDYDTFLNIGANLKKEYSFLKDMPDDNFLLEGFLFPDTYYFKKYDNKDSIQFEKYSEQISKDILKKFLYNFESKITDEIRQGFKKQGLSFYEGIILASIVEREVWIDEDKPIVASVLLNRLHANMALQVDSTIVYSLKSNGNNNFLTPKNTLGEQFLNIKSDYNTYKNTGLPPSPISNPGIESMLAVANAPETNFWYYLSRQDTGETIFSKNLEEHNKNKYKYLR